jgi:nucleotide-binding universal stress UspA family protein
MKTFAINRILVPIDFSETGMIAINHAASMAKLFSAHLYLIHVVKSIEHAYSENEPEALMENTEEAHQMASERIDKIVADLRSQYDISISPLINLGKLAQGISKTCKNENIDLVIMGTHGASGFEEYLIGSNADKVVNASPCPVITIQAPVKNTGFANIIMPIDNSSHSRQKIDYVIEIARHHNSKIHILGLLNNMEYLDERKFNIKLDSVENAIKKTKLPYVRKLINCRNIALEAMKYSYEVRADLLVIMTDYEESRYSGLLLGYMTKHVINHSKVPVMSIRPVEHYSTGGMYSN